DVGAAGEGAAVAAGCVSAPVTEAGTAGNSRQTNGTAPASSTNAASPVKVRFIAAPFRHTLAICRAAGYNRSAGPAVLRFGPKQLGFYARRACPAGFYFYCMVRQRWVCLPGKALL